VGLVDFCLQSQATAIPAVRALDRNTDRGFHVGFRGALCAVNIAQDCFCHLMHPVGERTKLLCVSLPSSASRMVADYVHTFVLPASSAGLPVDGAENRRPERQTPLVLQTRTFPLSALGALKNEALIAKPT
jgi:hypothetical protein